MAELCGVGWVEGQQECDDPLALNVKKPREGEEAWPLSQKQPCWLW